MSEELDDLSKVTSTKEKRSTDFSVAAAPEAPALSSIKKNTNKTTPVMINRSKVSTIKEIAKEMQLQVSEATGVLDDLLNYDKIEHGTLTLEWSLVPIWTLVERSAKEFSVPALRKKIELDVQFECPSTFPSLLNHHDKPHGHCVRLADDIECGSRVNNVTETANVQSSSDLPEAARGLLVIGDVVRTAQVIRNLLSKCSLVFAMALALAVVVMRT